MTEPIADRVNQKIDQAADLYHRLVILAAPASAGDVMLVVAERLLRGPTDQQMKIKGLYGQRLPSRLQSTFSVTNIWDETQSLCALNIARPASPWLWPSIFPKCALGKPEALDTVQSSIGHWQK